MFTAFLAAVLVLLQNITFKNLTNQTLLTQHTSVRNYFREYDLLVPGPSHLLGVAASAPHP